MYAQPKMNRRTPSSPLLFTQVDHIDIQENSIFCSFAIPHVTAILSCLTKNQVCAPHKAYGAGCVRIGGGEGVDARGGNCVRESVEFGDGSHLTGIWSACVFCMVIVLMLTRPIRGSEVVFGIYMYDGWRGDSRCPVRIHSHP